MASQNHTRRLIIQMKCTVARDDLIGVAYKKHKLVDEKKKTHLKTAAFGENSI